MKRPASHDVISRGDRECDTYQRYTEVPLTVGPTGSAKVALCPGGGSLHGVLPAVQHG